jgi:hypothetical protein
MAFQGSMMAFRLSPLAFCFPQCLSTFRDFLLLSAKAFLYFSKAFQIFLTAFHFPRNPRKFIYFGKYTKSLLFELCSSSPLCSPSFIIATRSPSVIIATMPTSHPTKAIRMSRCKFGRINISPVKFTPMKNISHM